MSLWTPGGEHPVDREQGDQPARPTPEGAPDLESLTPEQRAQAEAMAQEMAEAQQRLAETPAGLVVANHVMGLYELAAIHLSAQPPNLVEARVAVDAMAAVVEALDGRLGESEAVLRDALAQLRLAYVQLQGTAPGPGEHAEVDDGSDD